LSTNVHINFNVSQQLRDFHYHVQQMNEYDTELFNNNLAVE